LVLSALTKQEIRTLEGKLVKLFSQQLAAKAGAHADPTASPASLKPFARYPSLSQWLRAVGVSPESQRAVEDKCASMDQLCDMADNGLKSLLLAAPSSLPVTQRNEDYRRLATALRNLRLFSAATSRGSEATKQMELHWDSWNRASAALSAASLSSSYISNASPSSSLECSAASSSTSSPKPETSGHSYMYGQSVSVASSTLSASQHPAHPSNLPPPPPPKPDSVASSLSSNSSIASSSLPPPSPGLALSPPVNWPEKKGTPPNTPPAWATAAATTTAPNSSGKSNKSGFPTTPPPNRKHSTTAFAGGSAAAAAALAAVSNQSPAPINQRGAANTDFPLSKSRSHECDLGVRMNPAHASAPAYDNRIAEEDENAADVLVGGGGGGPRSSDSGLTTPGSRAGISSAAVAAALTSRRRRQATSESSALPDDPHPVGASPSPLPSPSPFDSSSGLETSGSSSSASLQLQVPRSPRTPRSMRHAIRHRFKKTLKPGRCDLCQEYMFNGE